jgi:hypothetical protein
MSKIVLLEDKILRTTLILMCGGTKDDAIKELKDNVGVREVELPESATKAFYYDIRPEETDKKFDCSFMWLPYYDWPMIVHETIHLVARNFNRVGISMEWPNDEPVAYFMEYWTREIAKAFRESKKSPPTNKEIKQ